MRVTRCSQCTKKSEQVSNVVRTRSAQRNENARPVAPNNFDDKGKTRAIQPKKDFRSWNSPRRGEQIESQIWIQRERRQGSRGKKMTDARTSKSVWWRRAILDGSARSTR